MDEVPGLVLLPDEWTLPEGLSFTAQPADYTTNTYTAGQWSEMEAAGAVFLPAAARRVVKDMYNISSNRRGYYWTSSIAAGDNKAQFVDFRPAKTVTLSDDYISVGFSVRLAMDITRHTVTFVDWNGTELASVIVEEGKDATAPDDPTREGYTFTGWDTDFSSVTEDLIVKATYKPNDPTGVDEVGSQKSKVESRKVLRDGVLYILRDGKTFNAQGTLVK